MKRLAIILLMLLLSLVSPGTLSTQAAEIAPDRSVITYTFNPEHIELTDVNASSGGMLYITDKANGVAVVFDPLIPEYKVFSLAISGDTGDVQPGPDGRVWYTDNVELLGVLDPAACDTYMESCPGKVWRFPGLGSDLDRINIGPITFDNQGRVWVGDFAGTIPRLYRATQINATNLEYCPYDIGFYHTHDLKFYNGAVWFGDYYNHRIQRFDPLTETLSYWQLPVESDPDGMIFDASGGLWWGEITRGYIGHLTFGETDTLIYYAIPNTAQPVGISVRAGKIWYSDKNGKVGQLDPATAVPASSVPSTEMPSGEKSTICQTFTPDFAESAYFIETKPIAFSTFDPPLVPDISDTGWTIYSLPAGAKPAGMATAGNAVFVADSDTSTKGIGKLMRFTLPQDQYQVYLPLILR